MLRPSTSMKNRASRCAHLGYRAERHVLIGSMWADGWTGLNKLSSTEEGARRRGGQPFRPQGQLRGGRCEPCRRVSISVALS